MTRYSTLQIGYDDYYDCCIHHLRNVQIAYYGHLFSTHKTNDLADICIIHEIDADKNHYAISLNLRTRSYVVEVNGEKVYTVWFALQDEMRAFVKSIDLKFIKTQIRTIEAYIEKKYPAKNKNRNENEKNDDMGR